MNHKPIWRWCFFCAVHLKKIFSSQNGESSPSLSTVHICSQSCTLSPRLWLLSWSVFLKIHRLQATQRPWLWISASKQWNDEHVAFSWAVRKTLVGCFIYESVLPSYMGVYNKPLFHKDSYQPTSISMECHWWLLLQELSSTNKD